MNIFRQNYEDDFTKFRLKYYEHAQDNKELNY